LCPRAAIGFTDGLTAAEPVPHTVIHVVPLRAAAGTATLPECSEWVYDDAVTIGILAAREPSRRGLDTAATASVARVQCASPAARARHIGTDGPV